MKNLQPLEARIAAIRAEIDALIDEHVDELAKVTPGVPPGVIRQTITPGRCLCDDFVALREKGAL